MKKILCFVMAVLTFLMLCGCGKSENKKATNRPAESDVSSATEKSNITYEGLELIGNTDIEKFDREVTIVDYSDHTLYVAKSGYDANENGESPLTENYKTAENVKFFECRTETLLKKDSTKESKAIITELTKEQFCDYTVFTPFSGAKLWLDKSGNVTTIIIWNETEVLE